jgi:hypothetical protein
MAQESRITSFEKALKDEGIAGTNLESVARSIFQQESSSGANVKTSNAGARGPMQVLPATFKAYNPQGNIDDPYDNSVGGLRYIKDLFSKTNDLGLTAVGYYGGPKAIEKAKQGVAVSDPRNPNAPNTLQYMEQVMGRTKGSQAQPTPRGNKPPVNPLIKQKITDLGPSYQAALALMAKADDLNEAREKIAEEEELASAGADFSQAKQMLAQIKPTSPFPVQEPRRMAEGGLMSATIAPRPVLSSKDKAKQAEYQEKLKDYEAQRTTYNTALDKYNTEIYNPYKTKVDEYNKAVDAYQNVPLQQFGGNYVQGSGHSAGRYYDRNYYNRGGGMYIPRAPVAGDYLDAVDQYNIFSIKPGYYFESGFIKGKPGFNQVAPTAPNPFDLTAPIASVTQEELDAFSKQAQETAQQNAQLRGRAMQAVQDPSRFNFGSTALGDISGFAGTSTRLFADGGEVEKKPEPSMGEKVKGTAKEILRSMQYTPYDLLGAPVDIGNLALKGVDYVTGSKLATEKPVGGSDYLIQKSRELGIADKPTGSTTETLTRLGTGIISPTAGPRAVVAAGKTVKGTAKAALEDLAMASTGQGGSKLSQQIMAPGTAFAVRPKGGVYLGARSVDEPSLSGFDVKVKDFTANLDRNDPLQKEVFNFFDKKLRNYVTNQQGTVDDPIFKKLLEGKIENFTYETPEKFAAARAGDKEALKAVREAYDAAVPVNAFVGGKYGKTSSELSKLEQNMASKIKAQSPDNYITDLMVQARRMDPTEIEKYSSLYGAPGFKQFSQEAESGPLQRILNKTDLPPHLRRAIAEGEPVYAMSGISNVLIDRVTDMSQLRDYLLNRTPAEIKNMGVADVVEKSAEWHAKLAAARRDPKNFSRKQLFEGTEDVMPLSNNTKIVNIKTNDALALEGNIMKHCVGGSNYCNGVAKGDIKIYSLRDKNGIPHATIELRMGSDQKYNNVFQIKGIKDKPVEEEFLPQIDEFLTTYSDKLGDTPLIINESPRFLPKTWRDR